MIVQPDYQQFKARLGCATKPLTLCAVSSVVTMELFIIPAKGVIRMRPEKNYQQDGRLAPAYFSQEYKYFDQHLPTVKNETTV